MKFRAGYAISIGLLVLCLGLALIITRLTRRGHEQPSVLSGPRLEEFTSLEPIDAHTHISQTGPHFVGMLDRLHMHVLDILYVDDTTPYRVSPEPQKQDALKFLASCNSCAQLCTTFDPFRFQHSDFSQRAIEDLDQDFANGAVAVKIWKNVGMEIKDASGQYVMPDDPRFEPIYRDIAKHGKTLIAHMAEPDMAWEPRNTKGLSREYFEKNPQWDMSRKPGAPEKKAILQARDHLIATNPDLRVVGAHFGSMEDNLDEVAVRLDRYPNFAVDTAARVRWLVIQPRDRVRVFMLKYQDRILYGTDLHFYPGTTDQEIARIWDRQYTRDWRYFATDDSFEYQGHEVEGLNLPRPVLKKLYHDNAVQWIPGIAPHPR